MLELKFLLDKNKELTRELEEALKDTAKLDGDDEVFVEHLNCLKVELDLYNYRLQGQGDWPRKLRDEAQRLKTKLTDIAAHRVSKTIDAPYFMCFLSMVVMMKCAKCYWKWSMVSVVGSRLVSGVE